MSENKPEIKEYAGGWITERTGTQVPGFLKIAFPIIGLGCVTYFLVNINGEVSHEERGALVRAFNQTTGGADMLMYLVTALALIFVVTVVVFAVRKSDH
ncbi:MAG: hypothetical protein HZB13_13265 [Acidobacteria bacterium]|nr:hypothetical protein [Acidobacteriota bacterium]